MRKKYNKTNRNPYVIEGIQINKNLLKKYLHKEGVKRLTMLNDLSQISIKTETEILKVLEQMIKSKNYFKYCSSILINLNPGPNNIHDYLNLKKWSSSLSSKNLTIEDKKPHLYTFMQYVYETMVKENKDQVVNLLGPIGSGKTFNLIHTMEFFTSMYGPKKYKNELFDWIHKSIQLIHIFGSIYRENNIESTSCGIVLKLGFNQNNIISNFDIEAQILDLSLPFTESGRTFSIFHAFIKGANDELKKKLKLPEDDKYLSFFSKYLANFPEKIREKLYFNDLETWNKFYSLSKFFKFSEDEVLDILKCLSIIINLNELTISKVQITKTIENDEEEEQEEEKEEKKEVIEYFEIQKDKTLKKICKNLGIKTKEFRELLGKFRNLSDAKNFIISFMKQTYYIVFDFILNKMRDSINLYFNQLNEKIGTNNFKRNKIIYFLDFPGQVENKNLGGLTTNICNECLNMYAATGFYEIAEKLIKENIYLNKFYPIQSYFVVSSCMEKDGILEHLSKPLNKQNYNSLLNNSLSKINFSNCIKFQKSKLFEEKNFNFTFTFSHQKVEYNLENLITEARSLFKNESLINILSSSQNYVINSTFKNIVLNNSKDFDSTITSILCKIFEPIKDIRPFNIFYMHSSNSYKIFGKEKENKENLNDEETNKVLLDSKRSNKKNINNSYEEENIPKDITLNMLTNSFIIPILFWNWQGYKEWIQIDEFINEYSYDFEKIKDRIIQINNTDPDRKKFDLKIIINFKDLPREEVAKCTLGILSKESEYIIGKEYILMKTGTLKRMRLYLNSMIDTAEKMNNDLKEKIRKNNESQLLIRRKSSNIGEKILDKIEEINQAIKRPSFINVRKTDEIKFKYEQNPLPKKKIFKKLEEDNSRRYLLKEQCIINIISEGKIIDDEEKRKIMKGKYFNLYYLITHKINFTSGKEEENKDKIYLEELQINQKENEFINGKTDKISLKDKISNNQNKLNKILKINKSEKNLEHIIKIQSYIRKIISKNKYTILKYIYSQIILIQKTVRGYLTKTKFKIFLRCLKKIKRIQKIYHRRHIIRVKCATKIQEFYIRKLTQKKLREKLIAKKKAEEKGEYYNLDIEPYEDFTHNNYNLENALRIIRVQNNKEKLTKQLINEKDPKKIVEILLYGANGRNKTRAQRLGIDMKIEDKLINQGEIMKERKQQLSKKYEEQLKEKYKFVPNINKDNKNIFNYEQTKKTEIYKLFKNNNNQKHKKEVFKNNESEKIFSEKNYDLYLNNVFDRLHYEKIQIEKRKKMREEYLEKNPELKGNGSSNKKRNNRMSLKEIILSDELKELYKNNSPENINNNDIWPKNLKNIYLDKFLDEKGEKSLSPIKNSGIYIIEDNKSEIFQ